MDVFQMWTCHLKSEEKVCEKRGNCCGNQIYQFLFLCLFRPVFSSTALRLLKIMSVSEGFNWT